jgi:hypothetical protein
VAAPGQILRFAKSDDGVSSRRAVREERPVKIDTPGHFVDFRMSDRALT